MCVVYVLYVNGSCIQNIFKVDTEMTCLKKSKEQTTFSNELELYDPWLRCLRLSVVKCCTLNVLEYKFFCWYLCGKFFLQTASHLRGCTTVGIQAEIGSSLSLG